MTIKKCLLLTGAAGDLGGEICKKLSESYFLILIDINKTEIIETLEYEQKAIFFKADITDYEKIREIKETVKVYDISAMILAAGILEVMSFKNTAIEDWERTISINLTANYVFCKEFYECLLKNGGGHIVFIGSVMSKVAGYDLFSYGVSKAGLAHLSTNLALELMNDNIFVNCICPGFMNTKMYKIVNQSTDKNVNWIHTLGGLKNKFVRIEDIIQLITFLLNQQSVNGETIVIDNGYSIR